MKQRNIDDYSFGYFLVLTYERFCAWIFYRKVKVVGKDRIPVDKPVIFAMNHQNAVMDALVVLNVCERNVVFLARSDAFKRPFVLKILTLFKMLPVYRMRDGVSELGKNEEIFLTSIGVLSRRRCPVGLMPEGNHGNKRQLRPLVKGVFRIAFRAQEEYDEQDGVQIVPVGLDYEHYSNFRSRVLVNFGEPIPVNLFYKAYKEDPARATNTIRNRLAEEMSKYMIDIRSTEFYDMYMALRTIFNESMRKKLDVRGNDLYSRFKADKEMIRVLEEKEKNDPSLIRSISEKVRIYSEGIANLGFRDWLFRRSTFSYFLLIPLSLGLLLTLPLFLYGFINNIIPYKSSLILTKKFRDPQFHGTVKFVTGVIVFPVWYLILFILAWIIIDPGWIKWTYLISLIPSGLFAHQWFIWLKKLRSMWKYSLLTSVRNFRLEGLKSLRTEIIRIIDEVVDNQHVR